MPGLPKDITDRRHRTSVVINSCGARGLFKGPWMSSRCVAFGFLVMDGVHPRPAACTAGRARLFAFISF